VITRLVNLATKLEISDVQSEFGIYGRKAVEPIKSTESCMGVSTKILIKAKRLNLRVVEMPVKITCDQYSLTHNPPQHGLEIVLSTVKHHLTNYSLAFYGLLPDPLALVIASFFWIWSVQIFTTIMQLSTNMVLVATGATIVDPIILTTAVILWVLTSIVKREDELIEGCY